MGFFDKLFNKGKTQNDNIQPVEFDDGKIEGFVRYEAASRSQGWNFPRYHEKKNPATLGCVLDNVMNRFMPNVVSMSIISTGETGKSLEVKHETDRSAILNTKLFPLIRTKDEHGQYIPRKGQNVTFILKFNDKAPSREAVVFLRGVPADVPGYTWCMRVSIMIPVIRPDDNLCTGKTSISVKSRQECNAYPVQTSFVIFEDYNDISPVMKEFDRIESSALPKYKEDKPISDRKEWALIRGVFEQYPTGAYISY